ncbi:ABC transporter permease subunit [Candidatus Calescamantes bacterium]|nr:ABC transporter permease subunit [Candidatus Calescamantes bacterium]
MLFSIFKKEVKSYFVSPIAYVLMAIYLGLSGYFFVLITFTTEQASLYFTLGNMGVTLLFLTPVLTMRLFSEERRQGTIELFFTSPIRVTQIVVGKYLGVLFLYAFILLISGEFALFLKLFGNPENGPLITGYLGLFLMGASFLAIGLFSSTLTDNQIVAAVVTFFLLLFFWIAGWAGDMTSGVWSNFFNNLSVFNHFETFRKGVIDSTDLLYYVAMIFLFLFFSVKIVDSYRWR